MLLVHGSAGFGMLLPARSFGATDLRLSVNMLAKN